MCLWFVVELCNFGICVDCVAWLCLRCCGFGC